MIFSCPFVLLWIITYARATRTTDAYRMHSYFFPEFRIEEVLYFWLNPLIQFIFYWKKIDLYSEKDQTTTESTDSHKHTLSWDFINIFILIHCWLDFNCFHTIPCMHCTLFQAGKIAILLYFFEWETSLTPCIAGRAPFSSRTTNADIRYVINMWVIGLPACLPYTINSSIPKR